MRAKRIGPDAVPRYIVGASAQHISYAFVKGTRDAIPRGWLGFGKGGRNAPIRRVRSMKSLDRAVRDVVTKTVKSELIPYPVRVSVREDVNGLGEPILHVTVVLETDHMPDSTKMLGLTGRIRDELEGTGSAESFPLISFVSDSDSKKLNLELA